MTYSRRRLFTLAFVAPLIVALGCGGSSDSTGPGGSGYFVRFRAGGEQVSYTLQNSLLMTFSNSGSQYVGIVSGFDPSSNVNLQVYSNSAITATTYSGYNVSGGSLVGALVGYHPAGGTLYTSSSSSGVTATVTITELTATTVRGTFSATLYAAGKPDVSVTNGEFHVPRYN